MIKLRLDQLELIAKRHGFESYRDLLHELYVVHRQGMIPIAQRLNISQARVRKHLLRFGFTLRGRGGRNNIRVAFTQQLIDEITRDGIPAVASRMGIAQSVLHVRMKKHDDEMKRLKEEDSQEE